jgi:hypothetical protein
VVVIGTWFDLTPNLDAFAPLRIDLSVDDGVSTACFLFSPEDIVICIILCCEHSSAHLAHCYECIVNRQRLECEQIVVLTLTRI